MRLMDVAIRRESGSESIVELVAGLAVVVLTVLGLANVSPAFLVAIATIAFAVGLLLHAIAGLSQLNPVLARYWASEAGLGSISSEWSTVFLAGVAGIALAVLALLGVSSTQLVAIVVIACGASLLISSNASMMRMLAATPQCRSNARSERWSSVQHTRLQTMAGFAGYNPRHFALSGFAPIKLVLSPS